MATTQPHPSAEPLLEFRLAYLRAIARSWQDEAFRRELLDVQDIQPLLNREFALATLWPMLDIRLHVDPDPSMRAEWKPVLTAGWVGPDDAFVIVLPQKPAEEAQEAEALAAYYQLFPNFMGSADAFDKPSKPNGAQAELPTGLGIPGAGPGSLLAFGGVVLRAIALAWRSPEFLVDLSRDSEVDKSPVLSQWLGYNNPFNFEILFETNPQLTWDATKGTWNLKNTDGSLIKNAIRLNYPFAPAETGLRAIALTSYNNTGSAYPFTC